MLERTLPPARELAEITTRTDTRDYLAHATKQARAYDDYEVIVDIDAHVSESRFWAEICTYIENDMLKQMAETRQFRGGGSICSDDHMDLRLTLASSFVASSFRSL